MMMQYQMKSHRFLTEPIPKLLAQYPELFEIFVIMYAYYFLFSHNQLKNHIRIVIRSAEKTFAHIAVRRLDGNTKPKIINSDIVVGLTPNIGINKVKACIVIVVSIKAMNKKPGPLDGIDTNLNIGRMNIYKPVKPKTKSIIELG